MISQHTSPLLTNEKLMPLSAGGFHSANGLVFVGIVLSVRFKDWLTLTPKHYKGTPNIFWNTVRLIHLFLYKVLKVVIEAGIL